MNDNNGGHAMVVSRVIRRVTRRVTRHPIQLFCFVILIQALSTVLVESLSTQSHRKASSLIIPTLKPSSFSLIRGSSTVCPYDRISVPKTMRSNFVTPLFISTDDLSGSSSSANKTIELPVYESERLSGTVGEAIAGDNKSTRNSGLLPSYKQLLVFTVTTILIWLSEPLLSLVDTTVVGLTASTKSAVFQIAALGPATTLFDSLVYTTYFLAISTTNQLAPGLAAAAATSSEMSVSTPIENKLKSKGNPWKELRQSTSHLVGLAVVFGSIVSAITFAFGKSIIGQMVGGATNMGPAEANAIIPLATNYAMIRAAVAPFCIVGFVAQSFCLTILDTRTPAIAVAAASIVNIIGDLALSPRYGIQGAAIATALATVASCVILLRKVRNTTDQWKTKQYELEQFSDPTDGSPSIIDDETKRTETQDLSQNSAIDVDTNTEAHNISRDIPFISIPDKASMINLFKLAGPIFLFQIAKVVCYNIMTIQATSFGIIPLASHNIMMRVFFFFSCFGDSINQAAQSFFPQVDKKFRQKLLKRLFFIGSFIGITTSVMSVRILSRFGRLLTKDLDVIELMAKHCSWFGYTLALHPFIMLLEGIVLAKRDLIFMVGSYVFTTLLHCSIVFSPLASTFAGLCRALLGFQIIRMVQFAARVLQVSKETRKRDISLSPPL